jgi:hypothetical protein
VRATGRVTEVVIPPRPTRLGRSPPPNTTIVAFQLHDGSIVETVYKMDLKEEAAVPLIYDPADPPRRWLPDTGQRWMDPVVPIVAAVILISAVAITLKRVVSSSSALCAA